MSNLNASINSVLRNGGKLTAQDKKLIDAAPPDQKALIKAQQEAQRSQELVTFISNILRIKSDMSKAIIGNIR